MNKTNQRKNYERWKKIKFPTNILNLEKSLSSNEIDLNSREMMRHANASAQKTIFFFQNSPCLLPIYTHNFSLFL